MELLEHNKITFEEVKRYIENKENCCIVNPCGSGKTSIMISILDEYKDKNFIVLTKQKNAKEYYLKASNLFRDIPIITFSKMLTMYKNKDTSLFENIDICIVDEAHYIGADKWGEAFKFFMNINKPIIVGLTATPQRYKDQGTSNTIITSHFDGNSAGNFTSIELAEKGVFIEPEYVVSLKSLKKDIELRECEIVSSDLSEKMKDYYIGKLIDIQQDWEKNDSPEAVFREFLPNYMYKSKNNKILVYCKNVKSIYEDIEFIKKIIKKVFPRKKIAYYSYTYKTAESELKDFLKEDNNYIKILFSVDKIIETIHISDLNIMIMMRPSCSNRIIIQQTGRLNNINNNNKSIIIDMVNNINTLENVRKIYEDYSSSSSSSSSFRFSKNISDNSKSKVYVRSYNKCIKLFSEIDKALSIERFKYNDFVGTIYQICNIFCKNIDDVKNYLENGFTFEEAMGLAENVKPKITKEIFHNSYKYHDFKLCDNEREYVINNLDVVETIMKDRGCIEDEDIRQMLYIELCKLSNESHASYSKAILRNKLSSKLFSIMRNNYIRNGLYIDFDDINANDYNLISKDPFYEVSLNILKDNIINMLTTVTERELIVIVERFYGGFSLEEIAHDLNLSSERIRQIQMKALRKFRQPSRSRNIAVFLDIFE